VVLGGVVLTFGGTRVFRGEVVPLEELIVVTFRCEPKLPDLPKEPVLLEGAVERVPELPNELPEDLPKELLEGLRKLLPPPKPPERPNEPPPPIRPRWA
jgi:hypothetical protein